MRPTDQMLSRLAAEIQEKETFIDGLVEDAEKDGRDLNPQEMELATRARKRVGELNDQLGPMIELRKMTTDSRSRLAELAPFMREAPKPPKEIEYRSAGQYVLDMWRAGLGSEESINRLKIYNRAAAHQTTADNPGLLPEQILGPVINFVDTARPVVNALGARPLPSGTWSRPKVTQHTQVALQSAEKAELVSRKMVIGKVPVTAGTYGGYVNVSRQDIDWTQPQAMDIIISDLAGQYAIQTEAAAVAAYYAGGTAGTITIPATPTADNVAAAFWGAAGQAYDGTKGQGRLLAAASPDVLGILGPLFAPVNPVDAQSTGFNAANFGQGPMGAIGGIPVYVTAGFGTTKRLMVMSSAAAEFYEDRIGALQVVEPSVLGVQVAYAGYAAPPIMEALGIIKVTVT